MKAVVYDQHGSPDVLRYTDIPDPVCPPNGVVIRVHAVALERGDLIKRASSPPPYPGYVVGYVCGLRFRRISHCWACSWARSLRNLRFIRRFPGCWSRRPMGALKCS